MVSTLKRDTLMLNGCKRSMTILHVIEIRQEAFSRASPSKALARSGIEFPCDGIEFVLGETGEVLVFGEILPRQAVGIFIDAGTKHRTVAAFHHVQGASNVRRAPVDEAVVSLADGPWKPGLTDGPRLLQCAPSVRDRYLHGGPIRGS